MACMDIKTDSLVSFFSLWGSGFNDFMNSTTDRVYSFSDLLQTFPSKNIPLLEQTFSGMNNLSFEEKKEIINKLKDLIIDVNAGKYNSSKQLIDDISTAFQLGEDNKKILENAYTSYKKFYDLNKKTILQNVSTLSSTYEKKGVYDYFERMYSFFQVDKSKKTNLYLHHFPSIMLETGSSTKDCIHQNISLDKNEPEDHYLNNSCILTRRMFTPVHELGHFLFENSESAANIANNSDSSVHKLFKHLESYFASKNKKNPNRFAYAIIHEAFADSCSGFFKEKQDESFNLLNLPKINSNFAEVDSLVRVVYPIYKQHMNENKPISDDFFKQVLESPLFQNNFKNLASTAQIAGSKFDGRN